MSAGPNGAAMPNAGGRDEEMRPRRAPQPGFSRRISFAVSAVLGIIAVLIQALLCGAFDRL